MRSPWRAALALVLAAALVYTVAWYGKGALLACGLVFLLLVVCVSFAIATDLLERRVRAAWADRRRQRVLDELDLEQARAWARSETELLPAGMTDRLWAEVAAELERRGRDAS